MITFKLRQQQQQEDYSYESWKRTGSQSNERVLEAEQNFAVSKNLQQENNYT